MTPVPVQAPRAARCRQAKAAAKALGALPEWNLADLYPGDRTRPRSSATSNAARPSASTFEKAYKGRLAELAASPRPAGRSPKRSSATRRSTTCSAG